MHIWLVKIGEPLPIESNARLMRTALFADMFTRDSNNSIFWWTSKFNHYKKKNHETNEKLLKIKDNYHIYLLPSIGYKKSVSLRRYIDHLILAKVLRRNINKFKKPDLIIASLPLHLLSYEAMLYAKRNNIPVIVDVRDPWPDGFLDYADGLKKKLLKLLFAYDFFTMKYCITNANSVLGCSDEMLRYGLSFANRKKTDKDLVFYNGYEQPIPDSSKPVSPKIKALESLRGKFNVIYIGGFTRMHDPTILLDIADSFKDKEINFLIAGGGEKKAEMEERSKKHKNVHMLGWINEHEIVALLSLGKIGIAPSQFESNLFPNKAIMYISGGLPVISNFKGDLHDLIEKNHIGFNFAPGDKTALREAICSLYSDTTLYNQMSANASELYNNHFKSSVIYENYCKYVNNYLPLTTEKAQN